MNEIEGAAGFAVRGASAVAGAAQARDRLVELGAPARLAAKDATLWGSAAVAEAGQRLGWVDTYRRSRELLPQLESLRSELRDQGLDHVVLAGMGGSSLAPEVITRTLGRPLTILDTTDPHQVLAALRDRLDRTVVVVASKSGSTVETDAHRRAYWQAFTSAGIADPGKRFVVVTDPGSPLAEVAEQMGARIILADPQVGGRFSALTAFGLVPAALAGVNVAELLDQAEAVAPSLASNTENPALALAAALGAGAATGTSVGRDKIALIDDGTGIRGLGDWIEQLIAESTGKDGTGLLPVVVETPTAPGSTGDDVLTVTYGGWLAPSDVPGSGVRPHVAVNGPLGAHFLVWEAATALAGVVLGINPYDQPNVAESKENTRRILASGLPASPPLFTDGAVEVRAHLPAGRSLAATTLAEALSLLLGEVGPTGYLAIAAFLDRQADADLAQLRPALARAAKRPATFGWGPRFLHSTGQYHKGGPARGAFLQITGAVTEDLEVDGQPYTFGQLQAAQAAGDRQALADRDRPVLHLHLTDRRAGIAQLLAAAAGAAPGAGPAG